MKEYLALGRRILEEGNRRIDRTGTGTVSLFGPQMEFDLQQGFPLLTTKKMFVRGLIEELLWFRDGDTNNTTLAGKNVHIWDNWALVNRRELTLQERFEYAEKHLSDYNRRGYKYGVTSDQEIKDYLDDLGIPTFESLEDDGALGPVYGKQWRAWADPNQPDVKIFTIMERLKYAERQLAAAKIENRTLCYNGESLACLIRHVRRELNFSTLSHHWRNIASNTLTDWGIPTYELTYGTIDQLHELIEGLKNKPFSRRHIISAWQVADLPDESISPQANAKNGKMALAPCHCLVQFYVRELSYDERRQWAKDNAAKDVKDDLQDYLDNLTFCLDRGIKTRQDVYDQMSARMNIRGIPRYALDSKLYQRSADYPLGVPFNIASYALLTMMVAQVTNMVPGKFIHTFGDVHIYLNQEETFRDVQLVREPRALPKMWINPDVKDIMDFTIDDFKLEDYDPLPEIKYEISV
jgi:thymidylate synthase